MFYHLFERIMLRLKTNIEESNHERNEKEKLPDCFVCQERTYIDDGNPLHQCNFYYPKNSDDSSSLPLIIDIHGGGWICGDKNTNHNYCAHLACGGNDVASLSYRTADQCTIKEQIQDIFAFFHVLFEGREEFGVNIDKVFLTGDSAGAQLALLAYCINQNELLQELFSVKPVDFCIKGLILTHGVYYLDEAGNLPKYAIFSSWFTTPGLERTLYGKQYKKSELYHRTVSPTCYISKKTKLPPILLVTSKGDNSFGFHTHKLYHDLMELGKECYFYEESDEKEGHVFNITHPDSEAGRKCNAMILQFIKSRA